MLSKTPVTDIPAIILRVVSKTKNYAQIGIIIMWFLELFFFNITFITGNSGVKNLSLIIQYSYFSTVC